MTGKVPMQKEVDEANEVNKILKLTYDPYLNRKGPNYHERATGFKIIFFDQEVDPIFYMQKLFCVFVSYVFPTKITTNRLEYVSSKRVPY